MSGAVSYFSGQTAEELVERCYRMQRYEVLERRWRCRAGEIDLILERDGTIVFVEVKKARDMASAAQRIRPRQMERIARSAEAFLAGTPAGQLTPARIDAALVDGTGQVEILENAFGA